MSERTANQQHASEPRPFRRRWLMGGLLLVVVVMGVAVWSSQRSRPSYQGRPLDDYLADLARPPSSGSYQVASNAVVALGTNSLPVLLRNIRQPAPPHIRWFVRYQTNLPTGLRKSLHSKLDPYRYLNREPGAMNAVSLLGTNAAPLAEALVQIFGQEPRGDHSLAQVLPRLGPATLPHLKPFLQHTNLRVRALATFVVHELGPAGVEAAPELVAGLRGADENQERLIVQTLGRMGAGALPAVTNLLAGVTERERRVGIKALAGLLPRARELTPTVLAMLEDSSPTVRLNAAIVIVDWWPVFGKGAEDRLKALPPAHPWRIQNQEVIEQLRRQQDSLMSVLREGLQADGLALRLESAACLLRVDAQDEETLRYLHDLLEQLDPRSMDRRQVEAVLRTTGWTPAIPAHAQTIPRPGTVPARQSPPSAVPPPPDKSP
jgi:HEAT repeat protein